MYSMNETITFFHKTKHGQLDYVINLMLTYYEEENMWVGICQELNTTAYDETLQEAQKQLKEAVLLQLNEVERLGFISDFLSDNHISTNQLDAGDKEDIGFAVAESIR